MKKNRILISLMLVGLMLAVGGGFYGCKEDITGAHPDLSGYLYIYNRTDPKQELCVKVKKNSHNDENAYHSLEYDENNLTECMNDFYPHNSSLIALISVKKKQYHYNWDFYEYIAIYDSNNNLFFKITNSIENISIILSPHNKNTVFGSSYHEHYGKSSQATERDYLFYITNSILTNTFLGTTNE